MTANAVELPMEPVLSLFGPNIPKTHPLHRYTPHTDLLCRSEADGPKRILLADDEEEIRRPMRAILEAAGYEVFACWNGLRALEVFTARRDIDLLLTDLQMPIMCGDELSARITSMRPELPVVIVSGSVLSEELLGRIKANGWRFLPKPCRVPELLGVIGSSLAGRRQPSVAA